MDMRKLDSNVETIERRKHWRDRRMQSDRRNPERQSHSAVDCRENSPRRSSDVSGELHNGEVWWEDRRVNHDSL